MRVLCIKNYIYMTNMLVHFIFNNFEINDIVNIFNFITGV